MMDHLPVVVYGPKTGKTIVLCQDAEDDYCHLAAIDAWGYGSTSKNAGHHHKIRAGQVVRAKEHVHELARDVAGVVDEAA